jgi:hypothetical protein
VQFGLQFDPASAPAEAAPEPARPAPAPAVAAPAEPAPEPAGEKVVSLDSFRKKP